MTDLAAAWTNKGQTKVGSAHGTNHLIDTRRAIIVDVEATPARWTAEVAATKTMLERTRDRVGFKPRRLAADDAYGSGLMIERLMRHEIEPHIPLLDREQDYHSDRMWAGARDAQNERKRLLTEWDGALYRWSC